VAPGPVDRLTSGPVPSVNPENKYSVLGVYRLDARTVTTASGLLAGPTSSQNLERSVEGTTVGADRREKKGRRWVITSVLSLALLVLIVALIAPTFRRQEQYATLQDRGVTTQARIDYCANTTGSNRAFNGVTTCPATFVLHGATVSEDLLGLPSQLHTGTTVTVVVDPENARDVYPLSDVRTGYKSGWFTDDTYFAALAAVLLAGAIASQVIVVRNQRSARRGL
jgi:hypothetical protein